MGEESNLQTKILNDLRSFGKHCICFKIMKANENGFPDIFFSTIITGAVLLETKRAKGELRRLQEAKIEKLNRCGTKALVCHTWQAWVKIKEQLGIHREKTLS